MLRVPGVLCRGRSLCGLLSARGGAPLSQLQATNPRAAAFPPREWLLDVSFAKRETFAYACEIYGRILEQSRHPAQRGKPLAHYASRHSRSDDRVEHDELVDILQEATAGRNGWKRILARCSTPRRRLKREAQTHHDQSPALR